MPVESYILRVSAASYCTAVVPAWIFFTFVRVFLSAKCFRFHIMTRYKLFRDNFWQMEFYFLIEQLSGNFQILSVFRKSFYTSNSFQNRSCTDPEWFFPVYVSGSGSCKKFWIRQIRIHNTACDCLETVRVITDSAVKLTQALAHPQGKQPGKGGASNSH